MRQRGTRVLSWTSAGQALANMSGPGGAGVGTADCAGEGFWAIRAGGFLPVQAGGGCNTVAGVY